MPETHHPTKADALHWICNLQVQLEGMKTGEDNDMNAQLDVAMKVNQRVEKIVEIGWPPNP
jgi:hypothetical protein